jgi:hypothetical protein
VIRRIVSLRIERLPGYSDRIVPVSFAGYPAGLRPEAAINPCYRSVPSVNLTGTVRAPMLLLLGLLMDRLTLLVACLTLFGAPTIACAEGKQPMTVENLFAFKRVPDG